ncbi:MAG: tetratricopeptide repeat protein, partial [Cyanobacteriota/Melainabacteria group bacterium]
MNHKRFFQATFVLMMVLATALGCPGYAMDESDRKFVEYCLHNFQALGTVEPLIKKVSAILETDPGATRARFLLGLLLEKSGYESLALEQYQRCIEEYPQSYDFHYQLLLVSIKTRETELMQAQLAELKKLAAGDGLKLLQLGLTMENAGFSKFADDLYEEAARARTRAFGVGYALARIRFDQGRFDDAIKCLNWDLVKEPGSVKANMLKGEILLKLGLSREATICYMRAFSKDPCTDDAAHRVSRELVKSGNYEAALGPALTDFLCKGSDKEKLEESKKFARLILNKVPDKIIEESVQAVARAAPTDGHRQFFYLAVGSLFDDANRKGMAMDCYEKALSIRLNPPDDMMLARGYYRLGLDYEL